MTFLSAIILGMVQGIAEFLPISSSGHLAVFQTFFNLSADTDDHMFFNVLLHLGTLVAVLVAYRKDILELIKEFFRMIHVTKTPRGEQANVPARRMILMLIIATIPLVLVLPFQGHVEALQSNTFFIGFAFLVTGLLLFSSDRMKKGHKTQKDASFKDALLVGLAQVFAVVPGVSRSGCTISASMGRGFDREFAVKFSFLMSIPAVLGAGILELSKAITEGINTELLPMYLVGVVTATVFGYGSICLLKYIARKGKFGSFAYYCWGAGLVTLILSLIA